MGPNLHGQRVYQYFFLILSTSTWGQRRKTPAMCQETMAYLRVKQEGLGIPLHTQLSPSSSGFSPAIPFQGVETRAMSRPGLGQPHWEERISFYWLVCEVKPRVSTQPLLALEGKALGPPCLADSSNSRYWVPLQLPLRTGHGEVHRDSPTFQTGRLRPGLL